MIDAPSDYTLSQVRRYGISVFNYLDMLPPDTMTLLTVRMQTHRLQDEVLDYVEQAAGVDL